MNEKIGLLMGGKSKEREISLRSGKNVLEALQKNGYEVVTLDTDDNLLLNIQILWQKNRNFYQKPPQRRN